MKNSGGDENSHSALNLSNTGSGMIRSDGAGRHTERDRERRRAPSSPMSINTDSGINQVSML
jgi:hypothetical protein